MLDAIPCPFVYKSDEACTGHVVQVEAFKADLEWGLSGDGKWKFRVGAPRSHYHLYCSEKSGHSGSMNDDDEKMKCYFEQLPEALQKIINAEVSLDLP